MWIESHQSLRNHPKIKKAARLCGINEFEMIGRLHCLWWWALDYAPDGDVTKYNGEDIESAVDWNGTPYAFYNALVDCGFNGHCGLLEKIEDTIVIHDWHEYGGRLLEKREANAERMREKRATHVQRTTAARAGATEQNNTIQNIQNIQNNTSAEKAPRPRDPLFDAIAKVTCTDPATAGPSIGKIESALKKATPPYTPEEVLKFGEDWPAWKDKPPSLWQLKEQIGIVRSPNGSGQNNKRSGVTMMDVIKEAQKDPDYGK